MRGTVTARDCAYCRCFKEDADPTKDVNACREESLVAGYECSSCGAFMPPGATLDSRGNLICAHCIMNGRPAAKRVAAMAD